MSPLGKLLRSIRLKRNISELKAAHRAEIPLEDFVLFERNPEKVPGPVLQKIWRAIEMTSAEKHDFWVLQHFMYHSTPAQPPPPTDTKHSASIPQNVLVFTDKRGIRKSNKKPNKSGNPPANKK